MDFVLDFLESGETVELVENLLFCHFLERLVGDVGLFERTRGAGAVELVEHVGVGQLVGEVAVLARLAFAEYLLEHQAELLAGGGGDLGAEHVGDGGLAELRELPVVE